MSREHDDMTWLYAAEEDGGPMREFKVVMLTAKEMLLEARHNFVVTFRLVAFIPSSCLSTRKLTG
jgi:hypothetical protein